MSRHHKQEGGQELLGDHPSILEAILGEHDTLVHVFIERGVTVDATVATRVLTEVEADMRPRTLK